jgi:hypothetical protein
MKLDPKELKDHLGPRMFTTESQKASRGKELIAERVKRLLEK